MRGVVRRPINHRALGCTAVRRVHGAPSSGRAVDRFAKTFSRRTNNLTSDLQEKRRPRRPTPGTDTGVYGVASRLSVARRSCLEESRPVPSMSARTPPNVAQRRDMPRGVFRRQITMVLASVALLVVLRLFPVRSYVLFRLVNVAFNYYYPGTSTVPRLSWTDHKVTSTAIVSRDDHHQVRRKRVWAFSETAELNNQE